MLSTKNHVLVILLLITSGPLIAEEQSVVLSIPGMKCPACPVTVRSVIQRVAGVKAVNVDFDSKLATVSYDDQLTDIGQLRLATKKMGFDSHVVSDE